MIEHGTSGDAAPRGVPVRPIHKRQLDDDMLRLQRAASTSHRHGQLIEALRTSTAILLALGGIIVTLTGHGRGISAIVGFFWFLISAFLLKGIATATARQGALLQEMLDTALFQLPWRAAVTGDPVSDPDVSRLARKLKHGSARDQRLVNGWYDPTGGVHHPYDVLIAQEQNLAWDARLRRDYSHLILAVAVLWSAAGVLAGIVIADATLTDTLLSFYVPSLAAYQIGHETWSGQRRVATERERLARLIDLELRNAQPGPVADTEWARLREVARDIQDGIFRTRIDVSRVPEWFYRWHRTNDERDFADTAEGHRRRLAGD
jgi:hypothetical protein